MVKAEDHWVASVDGLVVAVAEGWLDAMAGPEDVGSELADVEEQTEDNSDSFVGFGAFYDH